MPLQNHTSGLVKKMLGRNSGLSWLNNKHWSEITREERYFCAELYCVVRDDPDKFIRFLHEKYPDSIEISLNWQIAYEVCFYRDWMHMHDASDIVPDRRLSKKRTFDLALFSDSQIILIEAKAHQGFTSEEVERFPDDKVAIQTCTGVPSIHTAAITSSKYNPRSSTLTNFTLVPPIHWYSLAKLYHQCSQIFRRADDIYGD